MSTDPNEKPETDAMFAELVETMEIHGSRADQFRWSRPISPAEAAWMDQMADAPSTPTPKLDDLLRRESPFASR